MSYTKIKDDAIMTSISDDYDFELDKLIEKLLERNPGKILIQLPDGLRQYGTRISRILEEKAGVTVYIAADSSYGSCDLAINEARTIGAKMLVHFGHTEYHVQKPSVSIGDLDVLYVPVKSLLEISKEQFNELIDTLKTKQLYKPLLTATVQHTHLLPKIKKQLEKEGLSPILERYGKMMPGQVIGCDYTVIKNNEKDIDSVIIVSGGLFHPLGASLTTDKPVIQVDPYTQKITDFTRERELWLKKRYAVIYKARGRKTWCLWIGSKTGQYRPLLVAHLEKLLRDNGIRYYKVVSQYTSINEVRNIDASDIDVHVLTSCPRIPIDDISMHKYEKPVLTPGEAIMVLKNEYEKYRFPW